MKNDKIRDYLQCHRNEIVEALKQLVEIPSVHSAAEEGAPFGRECARVLKLTEELYKGNGFETEICQTGGYLLSYYGEGEKNIGIFAHADVVPAGTGWIHTKPFEPIEKGGCIIGRGTLDDKSAIIVSLYCAKILKELDIPFNNRLVMYTGSNEESGMEDIANYLLEQTPPDFSFVADTCFPLYRGNKGRIALFHKSSKKLSKGIMINGGTGATVIGDATVTLPFSDSLFDEISSRNNERIDICKENDFIKITAKGIGKHSALPEGALSALAIVAELLSDISELRESDREIFQDIFEMSSCYYGEFFEIQNQDEEYGKLTCVLVKIETFKDGTIVTSFNIRYGEQISKDEILYKMEEKLKERGWGKPVIKALSAPQAISLHSPYVKSLLEVYGKYTDNENPECYINAGGTYRQYLKNAVEIGTTLSWERDFDLPEGHGAVHQPDEYININGLLEAIELTTLMVIEIDKII